MSRDDTRKQQEFIMDIERDLGMPLPPRAPEPGEENTVLGETLGPVYGAEMDMAAISRLLQSVKIPGVEHPVYHDTSSPSPSSRTISVSRYMVSMANDSTAADNKKISSAAPTEDDKVSASRHSPPDDAPPTKKARLVDYSDSEEE